MKLEIIDYYSSDIDSVWDWQPNSLSEVYFHFEVEVGEAGKDGGVLYQMTVATPEGLREFYNEYHEEFPDRNIILLPEYSWKLLKDKINDILNVCTKESWNDSMICLQRYFLWEYEE